VLENQRSGAPIRDGREDRKDRPTRDGAYNSTRSHTGPEAAIKNKGSILIVDDAAENLTLLTDTLVPAGYAVQSASSGELALASIANPLPDLVLLDVRMPGMSGFDVLQRLKARDDCRSIPVICLSAITETDQRVEGLRLGAVDFISKPFQVDELLARVQTQLELRRLRVQLEQQAAGLQRANDQLREEAAQRNRTEHELREKNAQLEAALAKVKLLSGLLPICSNCKRIRDDKGYWSQVELYVQEHSEATFSHGVCPDCLKTLYPDQN
jgi:DNA-binding response OmpR family regulator